MIVIERESETKDVVLEPLQTEPRLGGEGSGKPPPYYVATGQASHAIVGIDFGTAFSRIATVHGGRPVLIAPEFFPSVVSVTPDGSLAAGRCATERGKLVDSIRSKIGSQWRFEWGNVSYSPEDFAATLLSSLRRNAQVRLEKHISKSVLTVPTSYTSTQRKLFKEAAENSGLEVLQLINEPTAVALAHSYFFQEKEGNFLVYNLGAGSFAASVLSICNGIVEIKSSSGISKLGGESFDDLLIQWLIDQFEKENGVPFVYSPDSIARFRGAAERARIDLTMASQAHIKITDMLPYDAEQPSFPETIRLITSIDRGTFEDISSGLLGETIRHVEMALAESHLERDEINYLLLAGSSTNMPVVKERLSNLFKNNDLQIVHADESWPAQGAAIQASVLTNNLRDFVTWDVLSVPVGIELPDGRFKKLISRGTPLPVTAYHTFASLDGTINTSVAQGESEIAEENTPLVDLTINNCPPTSAQETKVEIAFCVRQDGIVHYSARHVGLNVNLTVNVGSDARAPHKPSWFESILQSNSPPITDDAIRTLEQHFAAPAYSESPTPSFHSALSQQVDQVIVHRGHVSELLISSLPGPDHGTLLLMDDELHGFVVLISQTRRTYAVLGLLQEKPCRVTLGRLGSLTTDDARERAIFAMKQLTNGIDPRRVSVGTLPARLRSLIESDETLLWRHFTTRQ